MKVYLKMLSSLRRAAGNNSAGTSGDCTECHPDWSVGEAGDSLLTFTGLLPNELTPSPRPDCTCSQAKSTQAQKLRDRERCHG